MSWVMVRLGEVLFYEQPSKYIVENENYSDAFNIPVLTAGKSFILGYTNENSNIYRKLPAIIFDDFTTESKYVDFPFKVKSSAMKILTTDPKKANLKFLYYLLQTLNIDSQLHKRYWISMFANLEIYLPPLDIQKQIVKILEAAENLKLKDQELIRTYDELAQSIFFNMFGDIIKNTKGWEVKCLGDICGVGSSVRVFVDELVEQGVPFYRGTEIGKLSVGGNIKPNLFITTEHYNKLKQQGGVPKIGDLLMPSICPDGRIFRVTNDQPFYFKDGRVLWVKVNSSYIDSIYLQSLLKEVFYANYSNIASGSTFAELKIFALQKLKLVVPPLSIQNQFSEQLQIINSQKENAQICKDKSDQLFNTLIQKAFKGKLIKEKELTS